jgi:glycosyltransferase involved in cell wall biosynthesis
MKKLAWASLVLLFLGIFRCSASLEIPIVVIIPSYNNQEWTEKTLISVLEQEYNNKRVVFIDDASTDHNFSIAHEVVARYHAESKVMLVHNKIRCGALANTYAAIHSCADDELWIVLDGDDSFVGNQALATFNRHYQEHNAWASFGQYIDSAGKIGHAEKFPDDVIRTNTLRSYRLPSRRAFLPITAPRTGFAWLFKLVRLQDLLYDDYFYTMAGDYAYMVPVLELAGFHGIFIPDVLYFYNIRNPINDARVNANLQAKLAVHVLHKKPYAPAGEPVRFEELQSNDMAALILISDNRPAPLQSLLYSILRMVRPLSGITVMYYADQENIVPYQDLISLFPGIQWIRVHSTDIALRLQQQLAHVRGDFVLLCSDAIAIQKALAVDDDIRMLKKTHTTILYHALSAEQDAALFAINHLPPVNVAHTRYGWYCTNKKGNWDLPIMAMTLWEKGMLQEMTKNISFSQLQELSAALATELTNAKVLGLIGNERSVSVQEE